MQDNDLTVCEMWDLMRPQIPPRSRLYHLNPIGVGTAYVESLTGYVARLAEAHGLQTRKLIVHEILPLLGRDHLSRPVNGSLSAFLVKDARALNGTGTLASDWVQVLEALTLRSDLRFLTLLTWADVLTSRHLQRPVLAWCPDCYRERHEAEQVVYDPLLWTLQVVAMCPRHQRRLLTQCPHPDCQRFQSPLGSRSRPGYCQRCARWLGVSPQGGEAKNEALQPGEIERQRWVVENLGELLAAAPTLPETPPRESIAAAVSACVDQVTGGNMTAFGREIGASMGAVWGWLRRGSAPRLELLLRMCHRCGISPLCFFTEDVAIDPFRMKASIWHEQPCAPRRPRRPFDADGLRRALEAALASDEDPPPPMREIASRLGYDHAQLHSHFPQLCRQISARCLEYRRVRGTERRKRLCEEIRAAARRLYAQGLYPSAYRIAPLISLPGFVRHPDGIAARHEVLRELEWEAAEQATSLCIAAK